MWYKFPEGRLVGEPRAKFFHVCFYDMNRSGDCFDEVFIAPSEISKAIPYVETKEDRDSPVRSRVFVVFENDDEYELKLECLGNKKRHPNFRDK